MPNSNRFLPGFHRSQLLLLVLPVFLAGLIVASIDPVPSSVAESPTTEIQPGVTEEELFVQSCRSDANCDDGNVCNGIETCLAGRCIPGPPKACWVKGLRCDPTFGCFSPNPCNNNNDCPQGQCSDSGTCVPTAPCNNDQNCPVNQRCNGGTGKCVDRPTCSSDSQCSGGRVCNTSTSVCVPACSVNRDCDDGNECTIDTCDGVKCTNNAKSCDDGNSMTTDYCDKTSGCVHERPGRSCNQVGISGPTLTATRSVRAIGVTGFTLGGRMNAAFKPKSAIDPSQGRIHITLVDAYGNTLVDEAIDAKSASRWKFDSKNVAWTYANDDTKAGVQKISISSAAKGAGFDIKVDGRFPSSLVPDLKALSPVAALIVTWTGDITGPCGKVVVPECGWRTTPAFGEQLFCRGEEPRGPGFGW